MSPRRWLRAVRSLLRDTLSDLRFRSLGEYERIQSYGVRSFGSEVRITGRPDFGSEPFLVSIGSHVTIADGVRFVTHDGGVWVFRGDEPNLHAYAAISVGDNVFIGAGAIILPGVSIANGSVVGAGSVVTKDVPARSVVAGVPARLISDTGSYRERLRMNQLLVSAELSRAEWVEAVKRHGIG